MLAAGSHLQPLKRNAREEKPRRSCAEATETSLSLPPEVQRRVSSLVGDSCPSGGAPPLSPTPRDCPASPSRARSGLDSSGVGVTYGCAGTTGAPPWLLWRGDSGVVLGVPARGSCRPVVDSNLRSEPEAANRGGAQRGRDFRREGSGRSGGGASPTGLRFPRAGPGAVSPCRHPPRLPPGGQG